jgi:hypothetical protein
VLREWVEAVVDITLKRSTNKETESMQKLDLRKDLKTYYNPSSKKVELVNVPRFQFLMIDGAVESDFSPSTSLAFQESTQALYGAAYTIKFMSKLDTDNPVDFSVMPLEGLWWVYEGDFDINRKDNWVFRLMIHQPDHIHDALFQEAVSKLKKKKGDQPTFSRLRLEAFREGPSVQILHLGPYADEPATVEKMNLFAQENGYEMQGQHHEIYLGNPQTTKPEKLKTILRHPVLLSL